MIDLHSLAALLEGYRFDASNEDAVQRGIASVLTEQGILFRREVRVPGGRLDFLVDVDGGTAIEVKIDDSTANLIRQLGRYAELEGVHALLVVTTRHRLAQVPREIAGKPVRVALLLGGAF